VEAGVNADEKVEGEKKIQIQSRGGGGGGGCGGGRGCDGEVGAEADVGVQFNANAAAALLVARVLRCGQWCAILCSPLFHPY
jgi:hypothetical protein